MTPLEPTSSSTSIDPALLALDELNKTPAPDLEGFLGPNNDTHEDDEIQHHSHDTNEEEEDDGIDDPFQDDLFPVIGEDSDGPDEEADGDDEYVQDQQDGLKSATGGRRIGGRKGRRRGGGQAIGQGQGEKRGESSRSGGRSRDTRRGEPQDDGDGEGDDDQTFNRLAGYAFRAAAPGMTPGPESDIGGAQFQNELASLDIDEPVPKPSKAVRRSRRIHKPNHETQSLMGEANLAFITGDHVKAIESFLEVIRMDPYMHGAWTSLATCYEEQGNHEAARQMKFFGAHVENDPEVWKELVGEFRGTNQDAQMLYCIRKALRGYPNDGLLLMEMADTYRNMGKAYQAIDAIKKILKVDATSAHDFTLLADYHRLFLDCNQIKVISAALRTAFDYHIDIFPGPSDDPGNTMTLEHVNLLAETLVSQDSLEEAVVVIRRGQRWLQGRKDQKQWDTFDDDREYDPNGVERGDAQDEGDVVEGFPLHVSLRHKLAIIRLKLGDDLEATIHINEIQRLDVVEYQSLFMSIGAELLQRKLWEQALNCLAYIQEAESIPDEPNLIFKIGICHHMLKSLNEAVEALRWVITVEPENLEARLRLASVLEEQGNKAEALEIVSDVLRDRAKEDAPRKGRGPNANPAEKLTKADKLAARRLTKKVLEDQMLARMQGLWEEVSSAEEGINNGVSGALDDFIYAAGTMIETFRLAKNNFGKGRGVVRILKTGKGKNTDLDSQAAELHDRLERVMGFEDETPLEESRNHRYLVVRQTEFYGIGTEDWLSLVIKYCCVLMVKNEEDVAMDILEHVMWAGLFNNRRCEVALRLAIVACSMRLRSYDRIIENCRRLTQMHQFRAEPLLLMMAAMGGGGSKAHIPFQHNTIQRFIHRELRIYDEAVRGIKLNWNGITMRWNPTIKVGLSRTLGDDLDDEDEDEDDGDAFGGAASSRKGGSGGKGSAAAVAEEEELDEEDLQEEEDEAEEGQLGKSGLLAEARAREPIPKPTIFSPSYNCVYGQIMLTGRAHQAALAYFLRAYEGNAYDPFLCLCIAQAFFARTMNRQVDNRNYMITQGMAFLTRYRKLSADDPVTTEEVEYNYGRAFHGLGIPHLAVVHYERVLESIKIRMAESDSPEDVKRTSLACQAAHNLMLLYAATGSNELVKLRSEWLAI